MYLNIPCGYDCKNANSALAIVQETSLKFICYFQSLIVISKFNCYLQSLILIFKF